MPVVLKKPILKSQQVESHVVCRGSSAKETDFDGYGDKLFYAGTARTTRRGLPLVMN